MEKLYYLDSYLKNFSAVVTDCTQHGEYYHIELDRTAFYPDGGGQPGDTGTLRCGQVVNVLDTKKNQKGIIHITDAPLSINAEVVGDVDFCRRFNFMQNHTAEHILSGIIKTHLGHDNVGFHMGDGYTTMDLNREISSEELINIELEANRAIQKNIPVTSKIYTDTCKIPPHRSKKELTGDIRIVDIEKYDVCACAGLHVGFTGEIGIVKIISSERHKGGMRLYLLCGQHAVTDYIEKNKHIFAISAMLSVKPNAVHDAVHKTMNELSSLKQDLFKYKNELYEHKANLIPLGTEKICIFEEIEDLRKYCDLLCARARIVGVFSNSDKGVKYAIGSHTVDVLEIGKDINTKFNGRGGGQKHIIQGTLQATREEIESFFGSILL